mgnify:CR=1 FL=1
MIFTARLTHRPADCWVRPENHHKAAVFLERVQFADRDFDITPLGSYVAAHEHTVFLVFEAASLDDATRWLGPPLLQDHTADISPVMELEDALTLIGQSVELQLSDGDSYSQKTVSREASVVRSIPRRANQRSSEDAE